jgi:hypothetical protein
MKFHTCVEAGHGPVDGERLAEQARGAVQLAVVVVEVAVGAAHQVLPVLGARRDARAARRTVRARLALATLAAVHVQTYSCAIKAFKPGLDTFAVSSGANSEIMEKCAVRIEFRLIFKVDFKSLYFLPKSLIF